MEENDLAIFGLKTMNVLILTNILQYKKFTAGLVLDQLCRFF